VSRAGAGRALSVRRPPTARSAFAIFAVEAASFAPWRPHLPEFKALFGLTEGALGLGFHALSAGALPAMPLAGRTSARLSVGRLDRIGLGLGPTAPVALRLGAAAEPRAPGVAAVSTLGYAGFLAGPARVGLTAEVGGRGGRPPRGAAARTQAAGRDGGVWARHTSRRCSAIASEVMPSAQCKSGRPHSHKVSPRNF
jgi:hypothetical protein